MCSDLLQSFQIFTELVVKGIRHHLTEFAIFHILLSVQKPIRNFVLSRILDNGHDPFNLEVEELR